MAETREFRVPDLGEGLEDAEIAEWHVQVGDVVELNQDVCDVETAKALVAIPSPFAGKVVERFGEVGQTVDVGSTLLLIEVGADGPTPASPEPEIAEEAGPQKPKRESVLVGYGAEQGSRRRRRRVVGAGRPTGRARQPTEDTKALAKPPVRKLAKDLNVDLNSIAPGSGPDGTITRADVEAAADESKAAAQVVTQHPAAPAVAAPTGEGPRPGGRIPLRGIRGRIAQKMVKSRTEIPEATCAITVDCTGLVTAAKDLTTAASSEGVDVRVTPLTLILKATALALRRFPEANSRLDTEAQEIILVEEIHLGVATDTERGLLVPVIKNADQRSTLSTAQELERLIQAARSGSIRPDELIGGTFTVNNYGALGTEDGEPIINHPEAAILGIGVIKERPWVVDGSLAVRRVGRFTLAFDHRIFDGGTAARFLNHIGASMESPARLLLHS